MPMITGLSVIAFNRRAITRAEAAKTERSSGDAHQPHAVHEAAAALANQR